MNEKMRELYMEALALAYFSLAGTPSGKGRNAPLTSPVEFDSKTLESLCDQGLIRYTAGNKNVTICEDGVGLGEVFATGIGILVAGMPGFGQDAWSEEAPGGEILHFPVGGNKPASSNSAGKKGVVGTGVPLYMVPNTPASRPQFDPTQYRPLTEKRGFLFRVTLELEDGYECWREVLMPANCSFLDLHLAIQIAFDWDDAHLFDFKMNARGQKIHIDEASFLDPSLPPAVGPKEAIVEADDIFLSDVFPKSRTATYTYDYGDDWTHRIKLVKTYPTCPVEGPTLVAGVGQAPPEDVGGAWGFEDFLKVLADKKHPEHKDMSEWAKDMGWKKNFDLEETKELLEEDFYAGRDEWNYRLGLEQ
ncbi:MAG: plasmid pRiA4b ORF-3 family protein [Coriobacteriia bacterium]|nr:plasmid pRiA4b ORF-3 family protein [Coriobacteriia bacterium]